MLKLAQTDSLQTQTILQANDQVLRDSIKRFDQSTDFDPRLSGVVVQRETFRQCRERSSTCVGRNQRELEREEGNVDRNRDICRERQLNSYTILDLAVLRRQ